MPYKEWLDDVSHWSARVLSAAAMAPASCPESSFIPEPPEADAALTIGLGLPTRQRSWQAASCPPDPASGFQFARLRANSTARGPVAFEASPLAVRMLAAGRLVGVVKLAWRGQTPWAKHILVGSSLTAPGRLPVAQQGCRRLSVCGACIDGFEMSECSSCSSGSALATFRMDVEAGQLVQVALVPSEFASTSDSDPFTAVAGGGVSEGPVLFSSGGGPASSPVEGELSLRLFRDLSSTDCDLARSAAVGRCAGVWDGVRLGGRSSGGASSYCSEWRRR